MWGLLLWGTAIPVSYSQRRLTEVTLVYTVSFEAVDTVAQLTFGTGGLKAYCYLKGANSRTDLVTRVGKQSTVFITKPPQVLLLKEYGDQRYMTRLTTEQWEKSNQKYKEARYSFTSDSLRVQGYLCYRALATLPDSTQLKIWYTRELMPLNKEFLPMAEFIPGLILSFESFWGDSRIRYDIDQILFSPVQQALFDIPERGYRLLEQEGIRKEK